MELPALLQSARVIESDSSPKSLSTGDKFLLSSQNQYNKKQTYRL